MSATASEDLDHESIDQIMAQVRQGDCFFNVGDFVWLGRLPGGDTEFVSREVVGFAVLTQTCDVVRSTKERPFVEMAPLITAEPSLLKEVAARKRSNYAYIPALASQSLVVDIDRSMTVEKAVLSRWTPGCGLLNDSEVREFQACLARKRQRFAFPDDFNAFVEPLQKRLIEKHDKQSPEGRALRALQEIRVLAQPSWDAAQVTLTFYFIVGTDNPDAFEGKKWVDWSNDWLRLLSQNARFPEVFPVVSELRSLMASDYLQSDMLNLDRLSGV